MDNREIHDQMMRYTRLFKEMDDVYHTLARHYGFSDCGLWILYMLRESDCPITQSRLCEELSLSKQTVNSALKKLEAAGLVFLRPAVGSQKNKQIFLTDRGEGLAKQTVDHVFRVEQSAFGRLSPQERDQLLTLSQKYTALLQREAEKLLATTE